MISSLFQVSCLRANDPDFAESIKYCAGNDGRWLVSF